MTGDYLITTDGSFFAPDGKIYDAVFGSVVILGDDALGVKTNRNATNWYAMVGTDENHVIVAGCQIHYAVKTKLELINKETSGTWDTSLAKEDKPVEVEMRSRIYLAVRYISH